MKDKNRKENIVAEAQENTATALEEEEFDLEEILEEYASDPDEDVSIKEPEASEEPAEAEPEEPEASEEPAEAEPEEPEASEEHAEAEPEEPEASEEPAEAEPEESEASENFAKEQERSRDPEDTARFIQEQVSSALGDSYSEETLQAQEKRAAQIRKERERKAAKQAREEQRKKRIIALKKMLHGKRRKKEKDAPEEQTDNVIQMPVSKLKPLRDRINNLSEKAKNYADGMYAASEIPGMEEEEEEIPKTDEEQRSKRMKNSRERKPRRAYKPEPDIPPAELAKRYSKGLRNMRNRIKGLILLNVVMFYLSFAMDSALPLPIMLKEQPWMMAGILLWCLGAACLLALDALWMGLTALHRKRLGTHTVMTCGVIATLLDGLWYCLIGRQGGMPLAAPAALLLLGTLWGTYDRKKGLAKACETASLSTTPYRVTQDRDKWEGRSAFNKELGTMEQFGSQIQSPDGAIRMYQLFVPLILIAAVLFALISSCGQMHPERFLWCLSVILTAGTPMSGMLAYSQPYLRLTRRLNNSVALAGWDGVLSMGGEADILLRDDDLFPLGSVKSQGIKTFHSVPLERVTSCTASMIRASGSGLTNLFSDLVQVQGGFFRRVDALTYHEAGGLVATIRGKQVMIGTAGFMTVMHIPLKQGEYVKEAIFCAINGQLQAIFALKYDQSRNVGPALEALMHMGVKPILATRDFNITPIMLHRRFKLPANKMEYPNVRRRHELSEPGQPHNRVLGALIRRDGVGPFADAIIGARRLRKVVRWNVVLTLLASMVGMVLTFYLTFIAAYLSLSVLNMLLFLSLWLVPNLLISAAADKF